MRHFAPLWAALLDDPFASSACYEGIVPDLHKIPPYRGPPPLRPLPADRVRPMREMVQELLDLNVIRRLTREEARSPYIHPDSPQGLRVWIPPKSLRPVYSNYFLIPKKDGGMRGCLDLRHVNEHVRCPHFLMETLRHLRQICRTGDYMCSLDVRHQNLLLKPTYKFKKSYGGTLEPQTA